MKSFLKVLLLDDDEAFRNMISREFQDEGIEVTPVGNIKAGREEIQKTFYPVILLDLQLRNESGIDFQKISSKFSPDSSIVVLTGNASVPSAVELLKSGVFDYKLKPCPLEELLITVQKAAEAVRLKRKSKALQETLSVYHKSRDFVGNSKSVLKLHQTIQQAGRQDIPVLITGESGTGKEIVANLIHQNSERSEGAFVIIDSGSIPESLFEEELFGSRKGAFTGSTRDREGLVASADRGTLFFDEIGELPLSVQAKLLRFLETCQYRRVGENQLRHTDVRILSATNRDLQKMVNEGTFRNDLFFRINVFPIHIPPLRERIEDIEELIPFLMGKSTVKREKLPEIPEEFLKIMKHYPWPGNVRELKHVLDRLLIVTGKVFHAEEAKELLGLKCEEGNKLSSNAGSSTSLTLQSVEQQHIQEILKECRGNKRKAAAILEISVKTLYNKIKLYGLDNE